MNATVEQPDKGRSMLPLAALILVFALPMVVGWYLYLNPELLSGTEEVNGQIIDPPRSMSDVVLNKHDGAKLKVSELKGNWLLMFVNKGDCDVRCVKSINKITRVERALGRDRGRVVQLLLTSQDKPIEQLENNNVLYLSSSDQLLFDKIISLLTGSQTMGMFIVDPIGNLMLGYNTEIDPRKIHQDIKKLLTATKNWNKGCAVCPAIN